MTAELVVIGAGGFGRETLDVLEAVNKVEPDRYRVVGVVDDRPSEANLARLAVRGYRHLGSIEQALSANASGNFVLAVGTPSARESVARRMEAAGWKPVSVVHPSAVIGSVVRLGAGCVVCGGVQLSTNTRLGRYVHLNPSATIGHDAEIDDFVSVNPGAIISGEVRIGQGTLVGAGAVILQGVVVGRDSVVGASACVTRPVEPATIVKGVPAR